MFSFFLNLNLRNRLLFIFLFLIVLSFFIQTIFKGLENSCDLMATSWEGIIIMNIKWRYFLGCQAGGMVIFLFYTITLFEWEQAKIMINICLHINPIILCRLNNISTTYYCIGFFSYPTRMTFNLGQNSLMILFFLMLPFLTVSSRYKNFNLILSGASYVKYSTGYVLFLSLFVEKKFKKLLLTSIITVFGWIFYSQYTNSPLILNFFEPLKMNFQGNYIRTGDLYSIMNIYFLKENNIINKILQLALVLLGNIYFLYQIKNINNKLAKLSVVCFLPLIFMPHSNYDYVLMLPLLIYTIKNYKFDIPKYGLYLTIYYFYFHRLFRHWINNDMFYQSGMLLIFTIFIILFIKHLKKNNPISE